MELGDFLRRKNEIGKALKLYGNMLNINKIAPDELIALLGLFSSDDFWNHSVEPADLVRRLLAEHLPEFSNEPKIMELYFRLAELYFQAGDCARAVQTLNNLLSARKIYRAEEVLFLHGRILDKQEKWPESAKTWRRLLMTAGKSNRLEIIYHLAFAEMKSGCFRRAAATAFLAVPADGKRKKDERDNLLIIACLDILLKSAKEAELMEDYKDALRIKEQMERE